MRSAYDDEMMRDEHMRCELARLDRLGAFCDERERLEWLAERGDVCAERRLDEMCEQEVVG